MKKLCSLLLALCLLGGLAMAQAEGVPTRLDPGNVFNVDALEVEEEDGLAYYTFQLPENYQNAGSIYAKYMVRLLSEDVDYQVLDDYGWLAMDLYGNGEVGGIFAVLDDCLMLVVDISAQQAVGREDPSLAPAMDAVISGVTRLEDSYALGVRTARFSGFTSASQMNDCIQEYIQLLADYGYMLEDSEVRLDTYHDYYLVNVDRSLDELTFRDRQCHLVIEGFAFRGAYTVSVAYSPSLRSVYFPSRGTAPAVKPSESTAVEREAVLPTEPPAVRHETVPAESSGHYEWVEQKVACPSCTGGVCPICKGTGTYRLYGQEVPCERRCTACDGRGYLYQNSYVYVP